MGGKRAYQAGLGHGMRKSKKKSFSHHASSRCFGDMRSGGAEKQNQPVIVLYVHFAAMTHVTALCPFQSFHGPLQCDHGRNQHPHLPHPLCCGGERTRRPRMLDIRVSQSFLLHVVQL